MPAALDISFRSLAAYLKRGGVVAYPTESCYGLGCDPANRRAQRAQHRADATDQFDDRVQADHRARHAPL